MWIYLFMAVLSLCCSAPDFSGCREQGLVFAAAPRLPVVVASLIVSGLEGAWASAGAARDPSSCGVTALESRLRGCGPLLLTGSGVFPGRGSNACRQHRQVIPYHCATRDPEMSSHHLMVDSRASREGDGTPLQHSCLENPMDGGAWWAAVHGVTQSRTRLK